MKKLHQLFLYCILLQCMACNNNSNTAEQPTSENIQPADSQEVYRPQIHFSPEKNWMNDPNGMVYHEGVYHLFYQYYPDKPVWGPMHWGHATSKDLVHWERKSIALFPDSLGYIFSGSVVVDKNNTSGFGKDGRAPLIAIFTYHDPTKEKTAPSQMQSQALAYSNDNGETWTKFTGNPVLKSPGITDFRDPKVMWYEPKQKWIMTLAVKDRISFYSSKNLKEWKKESEIGSDFGAHGGVWECPDLIPFDDNGKQVWALLVNINPGGPNKGSATQYFLGDFDGTNFTPYSKEIKWLDYGPDEYAGVTYSNTGKRIIFLGWMSNWLYGMVVPTEKWRSAMTVARDMSLRHIGNDMRLALVPVPELSALAMAPVAKDNLKIGQSTDLEELAGKISFPFRINMSIEEAKDFELELSNDKGGMLVIGYDHTNKQYFIDRTKSGKVDFQKDFAARSVAPRFSSDAKMNLTLIFDVASVELFADEGLSVMTSIFFPNKPYDKATLRSKDGVTAGRFEFIPLKGIW